MPELEEKTEIKILKEGVRREVGVRKCEVGSFQRLTL